MLMCLIITVNITVAVLLRRVTADKRCATVPRARTSYNGEKLISNKMSLSEVTTMAIRNGKWSLCFCIGVGYGGSGLDTDASWKAASDNAAAFVPTAGPGHPCHRLIWGPCLRSSWALNSGH